LDHQLKRAGSTDAGDLRTGLPGKGIDVRKSASKASAAKRADPCRKLLTTSAIECRGPRFSSEIQFIGTNIAFRSFRSRTHFANGSRRVFSCR
jgi:hypothetical protein